MDAEEPASVALKGLRVLIVEDEPLLAMCLADVIETEGGVVVATARNVAQAESLVKTESFDVALLDLSLHGKPVGSIAAAIIDRGCAIVFSSGSRVSDVLTAHPNWPVLFKPYKDEEMLAALIAVKLRLDLS